MLCDIDSDHTSEYHVPKTVKTHYTDYYNHGNGFPMRIPFHNNNVTVFYVIQLVFVQILDTMMDGKE